MRMSARLTLFSIMLVDVIGFGIVLPILPKYLKDFGITGWSVGAMVCSYSLMQFFLAPLWGRLSDAIGRRPILMVGMTGSSISYVLFAIGAGQEGTPGILLILFSRIFAGAFGATLSVAAASIADQTERKDRSGGMALFGIAFGLGFIIGPTIGALSADAWGRSGPGWFAAAICFTNLVMAFFYLKESRNPDSEPAETRPGLDQWRKALGHPRIRILIGMLFLFALCFSCFETTFSLYLDGELGFDETRLGYYFAWSGIVSLFVYPFIGRLSRRFGDPPLVVFGLAGLALSMYLLPRVGPPGPLLGVLAMFALFAAFTRTPVFGMISSEAPDNEQGSMMGVAHSVAMLSRVVSPPLSTHLYFKDYHLPYTLCAGLILVVFLIAVYCLILRPVTVPTEQGFARED